MLQVQVQLWPFGRKTAEETVCTLDIINIGRPYYEYVLRITDKAIRGKYEINRSAHRNPWDHVAMILEKEKEWLKEQGLDYCSTSFEKEPTAGDFVITLGRCGPTDCGLITTKDGKSVEHLIDCEGWLAADSHWNTITKKGVVKPSDEGYVQLTFCHEDICECRRDEPERYSRNVHQKGA